MIQDDLGVKGVWNLSFFTLIGNGLYLKQYNYYFSIIRNVKASKFLFLSSFFYHLVLDNNITFV